VPGRLLFQVEDAFCDLTYETDRQTKVTMVRLRRENAQILKLLLEGIDGSIEVVDL
jgi:hypothetical protein